MKDRLQQFMEYKTGGMRKVFCAFVGWSPQYLAKLLKGVNFGLAPVVTLVKTFPELNARWLLTGEGEMLNETKIKLPQLRTEKILDLEKYIPVMTPDELKQYKDSLYNRKDISYLEGRKEVWQLRLSQREETINARIRNAQLKSDELCKTKEHKK